MEIEEQEFQVCCHKSDYFNACENSNNHQFAIRDCLFLLNQQITFTIITILFMIMAVKCMTNLVNIIILKTKSRAPFAKTFGVNLMILLYAISIHDFFLSHKPRSFLLQRYNLF